MAKIGQLVRRSDGKVLLTHVRWCSAFICKLRGLMFRRTLTEGEGLLLVEGRASRVGAAIHMLFMAFPIAVFWLDEGFHVVDKACARPWRPLYVPSKPARYTLEAAPDLLEQVEIGDVLVFEANEES